MLLGRNQSRFFLATTLSRNCCKSQDRILGSHPGQVVGESESSAYHQQCLEIIVGVKVKISGVWKLERVNVGVDKF